MLGRPPKKPTSQQIGLRVPLDLLEQVDKLAAETGLTRTHVIVDRLKKALGLKTPREQLDDA